MYDEGKVVSLNLRVEMGMKLSIAMGFDRILECRAINNIKQLQGRDQLLDFFGSIVMLLIDNNCSRRRSVDKRLNSFNHDSRRDKQDGMPKLRQSD